MNEYLERSVQMLGQEKIDLFSQQTILILGVGGVGGTALESLARSGFKKFIIVDCDVVDVSNLNRQILFTKKDIGIDKVFAAKERILSISEDIQIETIKAKIDNTGLETILKTKPNFIVDAIDFVEGKLAIYDYAITNNIKFISCLGMGNRFNPEDVLITTLNKTENDPLAKKIRYLAKQKGIDLKKIPVVFSKEIPTVKTIKPSSMMMVPSTAGLLITKYVVNTIK